MQLKKKLKLQKCALITPEKPLFFFSYSPCPKTHYPKLDTRISFVRSYSSSSSSVTLVLPPLDSEIEVELRPPNIRQLRGSHFFLSFFSIFLFFFKNPKLDTRIFFVCSLVSLFVCSSFSVTLRVTPLDFEKGWTGEL